MSPAFSLAGPRSSNQSVSSEGSSSSNEARKWLLPARVNEFLSKRRKKDGKTSKKYHLIKEASVEFILGSDEARNNNTKPERLQTLQQLHNVTQIPPNESERSIGSDLQQRRKTPSRTQPSQQQLHQPMLGDKTSKKSSNSRQQQQHEEQPPQETQPEKQSQSLRYSQERKGSQHNIKQPQNPHLFRRTSDWDEIRTPEGRVIPTFQGEQRPPQPKHKEPRLLPQPDFFISHHREQSETRRLSQRDLVSSSQVLFERVTIRQPSAPQLGQRPARRQSIIETPGGPQRASQIQYQGMERRMSQVSQQFSQRDDVSLPNSPQRSTLCGEIKSIQNIPLDVPQTDQRRSSYEYQRVNQYPEPPQREERQQPSTSHFSGISHAYTRYSISTHSVISQAPIQNYLAASQCVVGSSSRSPVQYIGSSTQSVSGPSLGMSHYHHTSLTQSISGPTPNPSNYHASSTQFVSGPSQGISQYHANSVQNIISEAKHQGTLIQSGSGYAQNQPQCHTSPQSLSASTHGQQYPANSAQSVSSLNYGQTQYQSPSTQISVDNQSETQYPINTCSAIAQTMSGAFQTQSQYQESAKKATSDSTQISSPMAQDSSQASKASATKCILNQYQATSKYTVGPSINVPGTQKQDTHNVINVQYVTNQNVASGSSTGESPSKCVSNSTQIMCLDNPGPSKGAIPKKKNDTCNTNKNQFKPAVSSGKSKQNSQNVAGPLIKFDSDQKLDLSSPKQVVHPLKKVDSDPDPKLNMILPKNDVDPSKNVDSDPKPNPSPARKVVGLSKKVDLEPKQNPSPPKKVIGPSKSASTPAKAKGVENVTEAEPQQLLSSYSHLVTTLSQNKEVPLLDPFHLVTAKDTHIETPQVIERPLGPFAVLANSIPNAAAIFTKMKNTILGTNNEKMNSQPLEYNPIMHDYEVQEEVCNAGPGLVWRVHDALRKADARECSVFMFDKRAVDKLYRPKRKELMLDRIKSCIYELESLNHPRMLQIFHTIEESTYTVAFATERIYASLHNILAWHESCPIDPDGPFPVIPNPTNLGLPTVDPMPSCSPTRPPFAREYHFLDLEIRHGFHQISEALQYMHLTMRTMHRNVCPYNILVTRRGVWKLFGLEFSEQIPSDDPLDFVTVPQWSCKVPRICQPHLDYMAPETQMRGHASTLADMYALGMILGALFNQGRPLINTNFNPMLYVRQMEQLDRNIATLVSRAPDCLHEALPRLLDRDPQNRPTTILMPLITYFRCANEPPIEALEALDAALLKTQSSRCEYYAEELPASLAYIPKKLRWQNVWQVLLVEYRVTDMIPSVLKPTFWLINECTPDEFSELIYPTIRKVIYSQRPVQITIVLLENLHILTKKCTEEDFLDDLLPMLFMSLDSNLYQIQTAALIALHNVSDVIPDDLMYERVVIKVKNLLNKHTGDVKIINLVLGVFEKILPRLDSASTLSYVVPTMLNMKLGDPDIINRIVRLFRTINTDEKFGMTSDIMATDLIPKLVPQTVNANLNVDQFNNLIEIVYDMLDTIERCQRHRLKVEGASAPGSNRRLIRQQISTENVPAPPFNIPNLRVEQRKTSSAENMNRRNSNATASQPASVSGSVSALRSRLGQWIFGSNNSTNNDGNFLRVTSILPNRRLSDNTLMTPKIRIAPSCASSPGGTPGGTAGLPSRRHSSIGPQERRLSTANLSPPTHARHPRGRGSGSSLSVPSASRVGSGSMPNTSSSVPFLATATYRRPSGQGSQGGSQRGSQGSGLLSHMVRYFPNNSATSSPRRSRNTWFQGNTNSAFNSIRHSANVLTTKFPSLNLFDSGIP